MAESKKKFWPTKSWVILERRFIYPLGVNHTAHACRFFSLCIFLFLWHAVTDKKSYNFLKMHLSASSLKWVQCICLIFWVCRVHSSVDRPTQLQLYRYRFIPEFLKATEGIPYFGPVKSRRHTPSNELLAISHFDVEMNGIFFTVGFTVSFLLRVRFRGLWGEKHIAMLVLQCLISKIS